MEERLLVVRHSAAERALYLGQALGSGSAFESKTMQEAQPVTEEPAAAGAAESSGGDDGKRSRKEAFGSETFKGGQHDHKREHCQDPPAETGPIGIRSARD